MIEIVLDQSVLTQPSQDINVLEYEDVFSKLEKGIMEHKGAGLAAIQIGISKRAFVVNHQGKMLRFANSVIVSGKYPKWDNEGCLSIPGLLFNVERFKRIKVKDDINGEQEYRNLLARIIQHEHDHTIGKTLIQTGKLVR